MSVIISAYSKAAFNEFLNQVYSVIKVHSSFVQVGLAICKYFPKQRRKLTQSMNKQKRGRVMKKLKKAAAGVLTLALSFSIVGTSVAPTFADDIRKELGRMPEGGYEGTGRI